MSLCSKAFVVLGVLALHGCAIRSANVGNPSWQLLADESVPVAGSGVFEEVILPGVRLEDVAVPADLQATLTDLEAACPEFAERILWVDCGEAPCLIHLWADQATSFGDPAAWPSATCGLGTPEVTSLGNAAFGANPYMLAYLLFAVDAPADYHPRPSRISGVVVPLHDAMAALSEATYGPPSDEVREQQAKFREELAATIPRFDDPEFEHIRRP